MTLQPAAQPYNGHTALRLHHCVHSCIGGELSKREGVLFHWWSFSSNRNDRLQLFYTDTHHLTSPSMPNMNIKTITLLDICLKRCFIKFSFHFEGVLLAVRGCTSMFRGCSRTLKTPNSPPLHSGISANDENIDFYLPILPAYPQPLERPCISLDTMMFDYPVSKVSC